jgi:hypothetical protein
VPSPDKARVQEVVDAAHVACPCSNATRNNVDVTLTVVSTPHLPPAGCAARAGPARPRDPLAQRVTTARPPACPTPPSARSCRRRPPRCGCA